jgi:hypothetical protein
LQFALVNGVDPFLRFSGPFCFDLRDALFIEAFPKNVNQLRALVRTKANYFFLD